MMSSLLWRRKELEVEENETDEAYSLILLMISKLRTIIGPKKHYGELKLTKQ